MKFEDISKCLVNLAAQADELGHREFSAQLMELSQRYYSPDNKFKDATKCDEHKGPRVSFIEFKEDGPYLNGARIDGVVDMNIDSKVDDFTKVNLKLVAKVHGLDDIDKGYCF